jgi:hypothetical protein
MNERHEIRSNIILRSDLHNLLVSFAQVSGRLQAAAPSTDSIAFTDGFLAAIEAVAGAYGIDLGSSHSLPSDGIRIVDPSDLRRLPGSIS